MPQAKKKTRRPPRRKPLGAYLTKAVRLDLWLRAVTADERRWAKALRAYYAAVRESLLPRLYLIEASPTVGALDLIYKPAAWLGPLLKIAKAEVPRGVRAAAAAEWELFAPGKDRSYARLRADPAAPLPPEVARQVNRFTRRILDKPYWLDIPHTLREDMARRIRAGVKRGESGKQIAYGLRRIVGPKMSKARSERIARTEAAGARNAGTEACRRALAKLGVVAGKEWAAAGKNVRSTHRAAHAQRVGNGKMFRVGGELCLYPGDTRLSAGERCNCNCVALTVIATEDEPDIPAGAPDPEGDE